MCRGIKPTTLTPGRRPWSNIKGNKGKFLLMAMMNTGLENKNQPGRGENRLNACQLCKLSGVIVPVDEIHVCFVCPELKTLYDASLVSPVNQRHTQAPLDCFRERLYRAKTSDDIEDMWKMVNEYKTWCGIPVELETYFGLALNT